MLRHGTPVAAPLSDISDRAVDGRGHERPRQGCGKSLSLISAVAGNHLGEQVEGMAVDGAGVVEGGALHLPVPGAGGHDAAAAPAAHEDVLDEHFLAGMPAWQAVPEAEAADR